MQQFINALQKACCRCFCDRPSETITPKCFHCPGRLQHHIQPSCINSESVFHPALRDNHVLGDMQTHAEMYIHTCTHTYLKRKRVKMMLKVTDDGVAVVSLEQLSAFM